MTRAVDKLNQRLGLDAVTVVRQTEHDRVRLIPAALRYRLPGLHNARVRPNEVFGLKRLGANECYRESRACEPRLVEECTSAFIVMRISAIVDARFSLIVDGETASSRARRGGVQVPGLNVP